MPRCVSEAAWAVKGPMTMRPTLAKLSRSVSSLLFHIPIEARLFLVSMGIVSLASFAAFELRFF